MTRADRRPAAVERFDDSFVVRMLREFFLLLVVLVLAEAGFRFAVLLYDFHTREDARATQAAEQLAEDVRSIMLNQGGPVAASTVYPILQHNLRSLGYEIAIEPSTITITSIEKAFGFTPEGLRASWAQGTHKEAAVALRADPFCLSCHVDAERGAVLGTVTVRSYLGTRLARVREEAIAGAVLGMGKTLLHTVVLFVLLRVRMEPVNALRATVSVLAKAGSRLTHRARVRSRDEFGELARDLNLFLDRVSQITEDLAYVLKNLAGLNSELVAMREGIDERFTAVERRLGAVVRRSVSGGAGEVQQSEEWLATADALRGALQAMAAAGSIPADVRTRLDATLERLDVTARQAREALSVQRALGGDLVDLSSEMRDLSHLVAQMGLVEEKMEAIALRGETLVARLVGPLEDDRSGAGPNAGRSGA